MLIDDIILQYKKGDKGICVFSPPLYHILNNEHKSVSCLDYDQNGKSFMSEHISLHVFNRGLADGNFDNLKAIFEGCRDLKKLLLNYQKEHSNDTLLTKAFYDSLVRQLRHIESEGCDNRYLFLKAVSNFCTRIKNKSETIKQYSHFSPETEEYGYLDGVMRLPFGKTLQGSDSINSLMDVVEDCFENCKFDGHISADEYKEILFYFLESCDSYDKLLNNEISVSTYTKNDEIKVIEQACFERCKLIHEKYAASNKIESLLKNEWHEFTEKVYFYFSDDELVKKSKKYQKEFKKLFKHKV